jgi:protein-tyrosine phosphatase
VRAQDFDEFDYVFAMDRSNLRDLRQLQPDGYQGGLTLFRDFDPQGGEGLDVPDPYYGGPDGFDQMFEMIDRSCAAFVEHLRAELKS